MDYPGYIVSNRKEESIMIQRVDKLFFFLFFSWIEVLQGLEDTGQITLTEPYRNKYEQSESVSTFFFRYTTVITRYT